jgi:hypothetical protein
VSSKMLKLYLYLFTLVMKCFRHASVKEDLADAIDVRDKAYCLLNLAFILINLAKIRK